MSRIASIVTVLLLAVAAPSFAQRNLKDIPDPDTKSERLTFNIAEGFDVNLYASDPMIRNPIQMNWDERGRLWVACSPIYPHIKPGQEETDQIIVLEDTDHDGVVDKSTVFADGLLIPTAVLPGDGGAYVANSTEMLHLKDTDGDGKADERRVVLGGFGAEDTHHILHTFRWGPDGFMYFNQSIYIHSHVETPWGPRTLMAGGIWRFRPESLKLNVFARGFINPWGHMLDPWGQSFVTDGANGEGINYAFPEATYPTAYNAKRVLRGLNPGQPKEAGLEILSGRHIPEDWVGTIMTDDFRGNRVVRFAVSESGSGYVSRQMPDVITTKHVAFRPIDIKMGPDGAIYILDWYNPIIQHGEVDFRDPRRDHAHGRIWRLTAKGRPLVTPPKLYGATNEELLAALKLPETWSRDQAKRVLKERHFAGDATVKPAIDKWVASLDKSDANYEHERLEALWAYQQIDVVNDKLLRELLASKDHRVRATAMRTLSWWADRVSGARELMTVAIADEHPRVRLEAVNALRELGTAEDAALAMRAVDKDVDGYLDFALWTTARELKGKWLPEFTAGKLTFDGKVGRIIFALKAVEDASAIRPLAAMLAEGKIAEGDVGEVANLIASNGGGDELAAVYTLAADGNRSPGVRAACLAALEKAAGRNVRPKGDLAQIVGLIEAAKAQPQLVRPAARVAGLWKVDAARDTLVKLATDADATDAQMRAGVDGLALLGGKASVDTLTGFTEAGRAPHLRALATAGLAYVDVGHAARRAAAVLAELQDVGDGVAVFSAFIALKPGPAELQKALNGAKLPAAIAAEGVRMASTSGRKDVKPLVDTLTQAGSLGAMTQQLTAEEMQKMVAEVQQSGDPHRGEAIYRRQTMACMTCHAIGGAGGLVGPDLISIGASAPVDYLIESLLEPSKKIKEGYHTTVVSTKDGKVVTGTLVSNDDKEVVVRLATGVTQTIATGNVQQQTIVPTSLMPPGLTAQLRRDEFVDLVSFLSQLGKPGEFRVPTGRFVRNWQVLQWNKEIDTQLRRSSTKLVTTGDSILQWAPGVGRVNAELPLDGLPMLRRFRGEEYHVVRFGLDVTQPGKVGLLMDDAEGLEMFVDGEVTTAKTRTYLDLPKGRHVVTFVVDTLKRKTPLKMQIADVEGSSAAAEVVTPE
ncbi:MAG: sorbosone dehydrogenase [Phycisphaera sp.]|nr:sorbosone dehydrogenase [Phycisphaera sp.]